MKRVPKKINANHDTEIHDSFEKTENHTIKILQITDERVNQISISEKKYGKN